MDTRNHQMGGPGAPAAPEEIEIDLKALFIVVCQKWRLLLLWCLIGALLGGAVSCYRQMKSSSGKGLAAELKTDSVITQDGNAAGLSWADSTVAGRYRSAIANYEDAVQKALDGDEGYLPLVLNLKAAISRTQQDLAYAQDYYANSLLVQANNPDGVKQSVLVDPQDAEKTSEADRSAQNGSGDEDISKILSLYAGLLGDEGTYSEIAKTWGVKEKYVLELVDINMEQSTDTVSLDISDEQGAEGAGEGYTIRPGTRYGRITVTGVSREQAEELTAYVLEQCERFSRENKALKGYHLEVLSQSVQTAYDSAERETLNQTLSMYAQMDTLTVKYNQFCRENEAVLAALEEEAKASVSGLAGAAGEDGPESGIETETGSSAAPTGTAQAGSSAASTGTAAPATADSSQSGSAAAAQTADTGLATIKKRTVIKYAVIGALLGLIGCAVVLCATLILRGKILFETEIADSCRLRHLMTIRGENSRKHRTGLDKWLYGLQENILFRTMDEPSRYAVLGSKLYSFAGKDAKKWLLAGTAGEKHLEEMAHKLGQSLKAYDGDFEIKTTNALNGSREALETLAGSDAVILVLGVAESSHNEVYRNIETVRYYGKEIVGTVAVI